MFELIKKLRRSYLPYYEEDEEESDLDFGVGGSTTTKEDEQPISYE